MAHGPYYNEGRHGVTITDLVISTTKTGKPQIVVRFNVDSQVERDGSETPLQQGYPRTAYLSCTEESREYTMAKLRHAGWEGNNFQSLRADMLNRSCYANCRHEVSQSEDPKYNGQLQEKWDMALPQRETKPLEGKPGLEKTLNALFSKELKATSPAKMSERRQAAMDAQAPQESAVGTLPPKGSPPPDDEVPF